MKHIFYLFHRYLVIPYSLQNLRLKIDNNNFMKLKKIIFHSFLELVLSLNISFSSFLSFTLSMCCLFDYGNGLNGVAFKIDQRNIMRYK